jgi:hypothetical protein
MKTILGILSLTLVMACQSTSVSQSKIIGGSEYQGMPEVGMITRDSRMHCTATLIRSNRIITAAHCLDPRLYSRSKLEFVVDGQSPIPLKEVVVHPQYDSKNHNFDIGYAELATDSTASVTRIYSGDYAALLASSLLLVGYGDNQGNGKGSGIKRSVSMRVTAISETKIRFEEEGKSACSGDSGGPAFVVEKDGRASLAGVTSCGANNCDSYGVYTRIDPFMGFLGLTERIDSVVEAPICGKFSLNPICEGEQLVTCQADCYEARFTKRRCESEGMRCAADSHRQRCLDESFRAQALVFKKLLFAKDGSYRTEPYKALGIFIDNESKTDALYGTTDSEGVFRDYLKDGEHSLRLRNGDRSYVPALANRFFISDQAAEFLLGDAPVQITVSGALAEGFSYYITGAGPLFRNYSVAKKLTSRDGAWVYEDALPRNMPYRIIKVENSIDTITAESALWDEGEKRLIPDRSVSLPNVWLKIAIKGEEILN